MKMKNKLLIITGPSCSGKTSIAEELLLPNDLDISFVHHKSYTTRKPRSLDELNSYYFVDYEEFQNLINHDYFEEYEEVYRGIFYGTQKINKPGNFKILVKDVVGAQRLYDALKDSRNCIIIQLKTSNIEEYEKRLYYSDDRSNKDERIKKLKTENDFKFNAENVWVFDSGILTPSQIKARIIEQLKMEIL